jgi:hypothetical protein
LKLINEIWDFIRNWNKDGYFGTSEVLIFGSIFSQILYFKLFLRGMSPESEFMREQFAAMTDSCMFLIGIGLLLNRFLLLKLVGVFLLFTQIMNTSLMILR